MDKIHMDKMIFRLLLIQVAVLVLVGVFLVSKPMAFLKANTIVKGDLEQLLALNNEGVGDIQSLIQQIPYGNRLAFEPNSVHPQRRLDDIIRTGEGDCSAKVHALAYYLQQQKINYNIVHILDETKFLEGKGHVALNTTYRLNGETREGIVDIYEGGLPTYQNRQLTVADLRRAQMSESGFQIYRLSNRVNEKSRYYTDFLNHTVIGLTPSSEVNAYFDWGREVYVPLGVHILEQYVYDGLSLLLGKQPLIYVDPPDWERLFDHHASLYLMARAALIIIRLLTVIIPLTLIVYTILLYRQKRVVQAT